MMEGLRFGRSVLFGWILQILLVMLLFALSSYDIEIPRAIGAVLYWNIALVFWLMGSPGIMFNDQSGKPVYEGTPADPIYFFAGVVLGLMIYPVIVYGILTWDSRRRRKE